MLYWYDDVFTPSEKIIIYKPPTHGQASHEQLELQDIVERVAQSGKDVVGVESEKEVLDILQKELRPNDITLLLTSGDLGGLIESIPKFVEEKFPRNKKRGT